MVHATWLVSAFIAMLTMVPAPAAVPAKPVSDAAVVWRLLDYVAVDYAGAVRDGNVLSASEYAEMREFTDTIVKRIDMLPARDGRDRLLREARQLQVLVDQRADVGKVAEAAHALAASTIVLYPIPLAPTRAPDVARGKVLYQGRCASCHGVHGAGDGPAAAALDPPPIAFTDHDRARQRSPLALYQVVTQGIPGTAMPSFDTLSAADRWALAYYVSNLAYGPEERNQGKELIEHSPALVKDIPDLRALSRLTEADLEGRIGLRDAAALIAYLRAHPDEVASAQKVKPLQLARDRLDASVKAYEKGQVTHAKSLALSAYLDGVEPIEPALRTRDAGLLRQLETAMGAFRAAISKQASLDEVQRQAHEIDRQLDDASAVLDEQGGDAVTAFVGSLTILLREGLEAMLIVVGIIAFLRKAERKDALRYVHAGWVSALIVGGLTWVMATWLIAISGANRELTEGLSSLFAAAVLLGVGIWMHQKSMAGHWQKYLQAKVAGALNRRSAVLLFTLAFVAVYREVFETILFYAAMWGDGQHGAITAGLVVGALGLALIAVLMLRFSRMLPIGKFFAISSLLIAVVAAVLAGKGVAALQEAGWVAQGFITLPRIDWIGLYPTWQTVAAQLIVILVAVIGFWINARNGKAAQA
ncbi:iron permease [Oleiagrimonas sp. MCCC 1A03011]|nr:iron permease [Oleiagrimonas sp. MCCC 1A03011]